MNLQKLGWVLTGFLLCVLVAVGGGTLAAEAKSGGSATGSASLPAATASQAPGKYTVQMVVDGAVIGTFTEISGLESEVEVVEFRSGDDPSVTYKRAGKAKYKNIVLKRGFVNDASLLEWYKKVLAGKTDRKSGSIIYLDRDGNEVLRYNFFEAWPCRWKAPELNSNSDTHLVEEIEFVVEKVERP